MNNLKRKIKSALKVAKQISFKSDINHYKLGACIFDKHHIYCSACNTDKTQPLQVKYNKFRASSEEDYKNWKKHSGHAEMNCIHKLLQYYYDDLPEFNKLSIFIYRQGKDGSYALAKPCKACEKALRDLGIKNIYYTGTNSIVHEEYL